MFIDFKEGFNSIKASKEEKYTFDSLNKSSESLIGIIQKLPSLVTLTASIEIHNSFGVKNHIYWTYD